MKKLIALLTSIALLACICPLRMVQAEDTPYTDTDYWNNYCSNDANNTSDACNAYRDYLKNSKSDLAEQLKSVEEKRKEYAADAAAHREEVAQLQTQIDDLQTKISDVQANIDQYQVQIDAKQKEIDAKQAEIDATQKQIDEISEKIKQRMVNKQSSIKINKYVDILVGASSLQDWLRIMFGLQAISDSDKNSSDELVSLREQMNTQKADLQSAQDELKISQAEQQTLKDQLSDDQAQLLVKQADAQAAAEAAAELTAQQLALEDNISSSIDSIKQTLAAVAAKNGTPEASDGWTWPVPGAYRSAGTWTYYGSSTIHLGNDFAAALGTPIVAAANGLIIASANGCGYGYLGDGCGKAQGGLWGGGNQVYELVTVGDGLYAILYAHMLLNSPIATGTIVSAGDQIGQLGSSGNSTGPHCHVEVTYLGPASNYSSWLSSWNGDLGFGCGWAGSYDGYGRRCEAGYSAPCRIRPETVFG